MDKTDSYISIVPNERQLFIQEMKFYAFLCFTINTFTAKEWGNGKENINVFNPKSLNTEQWCEAIKSAGMKGVVLTAKHHDGFCIWQTATTEHSIKNTPYKNGNGDIVKELAASCKNYDLKLGIYLSPWDRNSEYYGTDKYNDFFIMQLTELLDGRYGEIFMLWLDGACAAQADGKPRQKYDFERIWTTALKLQPNIVMSGCAPDVRWVGNESGKCRESEWNVVPKFQYELQNIAVNCQDDDDMKKFQKRCQDIMIPDIGSRKFLSNYDEFMWYPAEVDVSIRKGWFHHGKLDFSTKPLKSLMKIYYNSVGGNCLLILNIPPQKNGLIAKKDVKRLIQMGKWIKKEDELLLHKVNFPAFINTDGKYIYKLNFDKTNIDRLRLEEDTTKSQRIENFSIYTILDEEKRLLCKCTTIGFGKIAMFKTIYTDNLIIEIDSCRKEPYLKYIDIIKDGCYKL